MVRPDAGAVDHLDTSRNPDFSGQDGRLMQARLTVRQNGWDDAARVDRRGTDGSAGRAGAGSTPSRAYR